jgi:hypothetical protein
MRLPLEVTNSLSSDRAPSKTLLKPRMTSEANRPLMLRELSRETLLKEEVSDPRVEARKFFEDNPVE